MSEKIATIWNRYCDQR